MAKNQDLIDGLKTARAAKGLSQRALASRTGLPQSHISKIENGCVDLQLSSLTELACVLDMEVRLVPKKALIAVDSIIRHLETEGELSSHPLSSAVQQRPAYGIEDE